MRTFCRKTTKKTPENELVEIWKGKGVKVMIYKSNDWKLKIFTGDEKETLIMCYAYTTRRSASRAAKNMTE